MKGWEWARKRQVWLYPLVNTRWQNRVVGILVVGLLVAHSWCTGAQPSMLGMTNWLRAVCSPVAGRHVLHVVQISDLWHVWLLTFQLKIISHCNGGLGPDNWFQMRTSCVWGPSDPNQVWLHTRNSGNSGNLLRLHKKPSFQSPVSQIMAGNPWVEQVLPKLRVTMQTGMIY